jgi:hypothetical protein
MKTLRLLLVASLCAIYPGCAHTPTAVVVDCGKEVSASILPAVETALVANNYVEELAKLVQKFGECVIRKGVEQVTGESRRDMQFATTDRNARLKVEHGQNWLAAHPGS